MSYTYRAITPRITEAHKYYPVITTTGPRQAGKSTLCRHLYPGYRYVTLESIASMSSAANDPRGFLEGLGDTVIIDEVQRVPQLLSDMKNVNVEQMMIRGFYPGVIVDGINPKDFYSNYYDTYVERDLRNLLKVANLLKFDTFVKMLALRVGSEFNASALSREVGVSAVTISGWLSLLLTSYIVFELPPYFNNPGKSLTKNKKIYFHDTGLLCSLLSINDPTALGANPMRGAIFENLAPRLRRQYEKTVEHAQNPNTINRNLRR